MPKYHAIANQCVPGRNLHNITPEDVTQGYVVYSRHCAHCKSAHVYCGPMEEWQCHACGTYLYREGDIIEHRVPVGDALRLEEVKTQQTTTLLQRAKDVSELAYALYMADLINH